MKAGIYSIAGKKSKDMDLPSVFAEEHRPELISRAFWAIKSRTFQPYGTDPMAGQRSSAKSWGTGGGMARLPRVKAGPHRAGRQAKGHRYRSKGRWFARASHGALVPGAVGGRRAHPPKAEKLLELKINKKEKLLAVKSAIAATANQDLVAARGHVVDGVKEFPIIVEDKLASLSKTKVVSEAFTALGVGAELARTKERKVRSGRGKTRGRKYKKKVGPLVVVAEEKDVLKAAGNIPGVDVLPLERLGVTALAPGTHAGRLTIWTKSAVEALEKRYAK
jgi:large subunit ribosomal protein L4e